MTSPAIAETLQYLTFQLDEELFALDVSKVREILEVIEGPMRLSDCLVGPHLCARRPDCPLQLVWLEIYRQVTDILEKTTIAGCESYHIVFRCADLETGKINFVSVEIDDLRRNFFRPLMIF